MRRLEGDDEAPLSLIRRLKELEAEEATLALEQARTPAVATITLPANYEAVYRQAIAELDTHLASADSGKVRPTVRALIDRIVVQPGSARGGKC